MKKIINKKKTIKNSVRIMQLLLAVSLFYTAKAGYDNSKTPKVLSVSGETYLKFLMNNPVEIYYFDKIPDDAIVNLIDLKQVQTNLTEENLLKIKAIDFNNEFDSSELKLLPNIEIININDLSVITDEDKKQINMLPNLQKIYLDNYAGEDVSWLREDVIIDVSSFKFAEIDQLYAYRNIKKIEEQHPNVILPAKLEEAQKWDEKLTGIIKSFNFNEKTTTEEKLATIIKYIADNFEYDPVVLQGYIGANEYTQYANNLSIYYNTNNVSSTLDENGKGVCVNFATYTKLLAEYAGIEEISYEHGFYGSELAPHAWNKYNEDILDLTFLDNYIKENTTIEEIANDLDKYLIKEDTSGYKEYIPKAESREKSSIDEDRKFTFDINYENENAEEYNNLIKEKTKKYYLSSLLSLLSIGGLEIVKKKKLNK